MWIYDSSFSSQLGTQAGVFFIQNSKLYISTSDGSYQSPELFSSRLLSASGRQIKLNKSTIGAGVITAIQNS